MRWDRLSARRVVDRSSFAQKYSFSVMVCTVVPSSEVGFSCFGWVVLRLFVPAVVLMHAWSVLICAFCGVYKEVSLGSSLILSPSHFHQQVIAPRGRLDCLMLSSVWNRCSLAMYSTSQIQNWRDE
jgi:hypothetical protein